MSEEFGVTKTLQGSGVELLQAYKWPGNLRELKFFIRRLFVNAVSNEITVSEISKEMRELQSKLSEGKENSLGDSAKYHIEKYFNSLGEDLPSSGLFDKILREVERPLIQATMKRTSGNQIKASKILGINRNTLRKKIKQLNLPLSRNGYK